MCMKLEMGLKSKLKTMKGLDTVESLSAGARGSIFLLQKVLPKLGLLYDVDKSSTIPTVGITKSRAFGALILVKYF